MKDGKIPIHDVYLSAFLDLMGISPTLAFHGSRVVFEFPNTPETGDLLGAYNRNPSVPLIDYVTSLRRLRAQMLANR